LQKDIQGLDFFIDQEGSTAYTRLWKSVCVHFYI
jgi:hypothetical protein